MIPDTLFATKYQKEAFSIVYDIIESLPGNPVADLWRSMREENTDDLQAYYDAADRLLEDECISLADALALQEKGFNI